MFEFNYWCNRRILAAAERATREELTAPPEFTYRNLRGTLVHTLDVEKSWRLRLRGEPAADWDVSLADDDYPTVASIADHWASDEREMRAWLGGLTDDELVTIVDLGNADRFPLWYYLVHIVTHSEQQRRDAQLLLNAFGHDVPDLEFLYYADSLGSGREER